MKIFCLGLSRTGLTSLSAALRRLGYATLHYPPEDRLFSGPYDAASDLPVVIHYKTLDRMFSSSKFIYTVRDKSDWLASVERFYENRWASDWDRLRQPYRKNREMVFGQHDFDRNVYSAAYDRHNNDVLEYFKARPKDLLVMNICNGDGWSPLLSFLNGDKPRGDFPHYHKR